MYNSSWLELRKFVSPEIVMGAGALSLAGQYAKNLGAEKVLVVADEGIVRTGWAGKAIESLEDKGLPYSIYSAVSPNPRAEEVVKGKEFYDGEGCDVIVAVGGGSSIDCAKGIGVVSRNGGNILDYAGVDRIPLPGPPLICVPTTGSAADVSQFCVITDARERLKVSIVSKTLVPDASLIDPATNVTQSARQTIYTRLDSFTQAVESYVSNASSPVTDLLALRALKLIFHHLEAEIREPENLGHRNTMALGSLEAGLAFTNASLGLVHAMSHSLGGLTDAAHGLCCATLIAGVVRYNYDSVPERYDRIAETMGVNLKGLSYDQKKAAIVEEITRFQKGVGATETLGQLGVDKKDLPGLARSTLQDICMVTNPRPATPEDVIAIFEEAL